MTTCSYCGSTDAGHDGVCCRCDHIPSIEDFSSPLPGAPDLTATTAPVWDNEGLIELHRKLDPISVANERCAACAQFPDACECERFVQRATTHEYQGPTPEETTPTGGTDPNAR